MRFALHHVQLAMPADEEESARAFYGGVLGLTEIDKPAELATRGGAWFRGDDLDAVQQRFADAGIEVRPDGLFPGYRRFYADDCFGNRLEFLQPEA